MITGILLAAGGSERFGRNKLLQKLADGSVLGLQAAERLAGAVDDLIVVVRNGDEATTEMFGNAGFRTLICPCATLGMAHSLACGVNAAEDGCGWLIALADMPFILPATISLVADALRRHGGIVAPFFDGEMGHPVGFAPEWRTALTALAGDRGARSVIDLNSSALRRIETRDAGVIRDIDVPDDLNGS